MRAKKFFAKLPARLWLLLGSLVVLTFFSNDFGLVDIQKTAIVLAAGIDRSEEGYALTAQIAVPKGSDRTTGGTSSVEIEGRGKTVSDCITEIYAKTGWVPKLVFCDLILLGEDAARENGFAALDFFLRNEYAPDSCLLAVCEGRAGETLSAASAVDDASSLALEKLFSDAAEKSGRVMTTTLREFAIGYYGASKSGYMPYVSLREPNESEGGENGNKSESGQSGGGQKQSGGQSGQNGQKASGEKVFGAERTALFTGGKMTGVLSAEETFAFSLLKGNVYGGTLPAGEATLSVLKNRGSVSLEHRKGGQLSAALEVDLKVRLMSRTAPSSQEEVAKGNVLPEEEQAAERALAQAISSLWQSCAAADCDLFMLRRTLFRESPAALADWTPLSQIRLFVRAAVRGLQ